MFDLLQSPKYCDFFECKIAVVCGPEQVEATALRIDVKNVSQTEQELSTFNFFLNYFVIMCYVATDSFLNRIAAGYQPPKDRTVSSTTGGDGSSSGPITTYNSSSEVGSDEDCEVLEAPTANSGYMTRRDSSRKRTKDDYSRALEEEQERKKKNRRKKKAEESKATTVEPRETYQR